MSAAGKSGGTYAAAVDAGSSSDEDDLHTHRIEFKNGVEVGTVRELAVNPLADRRAAADGAGEGFDNDEDADSSGDNDAVDEHGVDVDEEDEEDDEDGGDEEDDDAPADSPADASPPSGSATSSAPIAAPAPAPPAPSRSAPPSTVPHVSWGANTVHVVDSDPKPEAGVGAPKPCSDTDALTFVARPTAELLGVLDPDDRAKPAQASPLDAISGELQRNLKSLKKARSNMRVRKDSLAVPENVGHKRSVVATVVRSSSFKLFIAALILVNAIVIGLETDYDKSNDSVVFEVLEHLFVVVFVFEVSAKLYVYRWKFFSKGWNVFDFIIVLVAAVDAWVLAPTVSTESLGVVATLRVGRVLRLWRWVSLFAELHVLAASIAKSLRPLAWVSVLLVMVMYLWAVFATRAIGHDSVWRGTPEEDDIDDWFGTIPKSLYTGFQVMTLESWSMGIARVVMARQPGMSAVFILYICSSTFMLLNLVVGVVVDKVFEAQNASKERRKREDAIVRLKEARRIVSMFAHLDSNRDGALSITEVQAALNEPRIQRAFTRAGLPDLENKLMSVSELAQLLDHDGDGTILYQEFVKTITGLKKGATRQDLTLVSNRMSAALREVNQEMHDTRIEMHALVAEIRDMIAHKHTASAIKPPPLAARSLSLRRLYELKSSVADAGAGIGAGAGAGAGVAADAGASTGAGAGAADADDAGVPAASPPATPDVHTSKK